MSVNDPLDPKQRFEPIKPFDQNVPTPLEIDVTRSMLNNILSKLNQVESALENLLLKVNSGSLTTTLSPNSLDPVRWQVRVTGAAQTQNFGIVNLAIFVIVTDQTGVPIADLAAENFSLSELNLNQFPSSMTTLTPPDMSKVNSVESFTDAGGGAYRFWSLTTIKPDQLQRIFIVRVTKQGSPFAEGTDAFSVEIKQPNTL